MDILDNIIFAALNRKLTNNVPVSSDYIDNIFGAAFPATFPDVLAGSNPNTYSYKIPEKFAFGTLQDPGVIETAIQRHWFDVNNQEQYTNAGDTFSSFITTSNYHLFYAYLLENTRILQIFEKVIEKYLNDEILGISNNPDVFNWILNSERLFYKSDNPKSTNIRSIIRPSTDATRRNAYNRMFGMDLAFGAIDNSSVPYYKSTKSNSQFIVLFERFLGEIWQSYINARNTSGPNTTDINIIVELAQELQEMLAARRGDVANNTYANLNLSKEEFYSVLITSWFTFIISFDSPVVEFLSCQSSTIGERLIKIGNKVGIPAHTKCQSLFEMSNAATIVLLGIEARIFSNPAFVTTMLSNDTAFPVESSYMNSFLSVINNWEKATGHIIKYPQANINASIKVQSNGAVQQQALN